MEISNYKYLLINWKKNTIEKGRKICWFCKYRFVKEKHIGFGYICKYCKIPMGYLQMW